MYAKLKTVQICSAKTIHSLWKRGTYAIKCVSIHALECGTTTWWFKPHQHCHEYLTKKIIQSKVGVYTLTQQIGKKNLKKLHTMERFFFNSLAIYWTCTRGQMFWQWLQLCVFNFFWFTLILYCWKEQSFKCGAMLKTSWIKRAILVNLDFFLPPLINSSF